MHELVDRFDIITYYSIVSAVCAFTVLWLMQCKTSAAEITSRLGWIVTIQRIALALFAAALFWTAATPILEEVAPWPSDVIARTLLLIVLCTWPFRDRAHDRIHGRRRPPEQTEDLSGGGQSPAAKASIARKAYRGLKAFRAAGRK